MFNIVLSFAVVSLLTFLPLFWGMLNASLFLYLEDKHSSEDGHPVHLDGTSEVYTRTGSDVSGHSIEWAFSISVETSA